MPLADVRKSISSHLGWGRKGLEKVAELVNPVIRQAIHEATAAAAAAAAEPTATTAESMAKIIEGMGEEPTAAKNFVYFLTVSRVLPTTLDVTDLRDIRDVSREQMAEWVRDAPCLPACVASMCFVRKRLAPPRVRNRLEAVGHAIS